MTIFIIGGPLLSAASSSLSFFSSLALVFTFCTLHYTFYYCAINVKAKAMPTR